MKIKHILTRIFSVFEPTQSKENEYLNQVTSLVDLERRIRELERVGRL